MEGRIFQIQKFCIGDGPGIRTTVFFKGCNLKCQWCHNPESQSASKELLFHAKKCVGCGRCKGCAPDDESFICYNEAREICGRDAEADELVQEILQDKSFYETSGGGVTFSGGECMLQIDFLLELLKRCKENGVQTAVDTAGHLPWAYFEKVRPYADLFLYDVKVLDDEKHKVYTGVTNRNILDNLTRLLRAGESIWVRMPIIPGVNDTEEEMNRLKAFFEANGHPEKVELLPYHALGEHKYAELGKTAHVFEQPSKETMERLKAILGPMSTTG